MLSDLGRFLFDEERLPLTSVFTIGSMDTHSGFVVHHFIASFLRGGGNVVLVSFTQTFNHYNCTGLKMGVNLAACRDEHRLVFIDGLSSLQRTFTHCHGSAQDDIKDCFDWSSDSCSLRTLNSDISSSISSFSNQPTVVLLDDIFSLVAVGIPQNDVLDFVRYQVANTHASENKNLSLGVVTSCQRKSGRSETTTLFNACCHLSDASVVVVGLQTGYSRDVDGEISVTTYEESQANDELSSHKSKCMQYKVTEKSIRLFPRGTSSAVL